MRRSSFILVLLVVLGITGCDTRHKATIYKTKQNHVIMKDDGGDWFIYTQNGGVTTSDVPYNSRGEMVLPPGGSWRAATPQEEEEVTVEGQATNAEETTVDETDAGSPDGSGDVGGDSGGDAGGGDSGGDGGGGDGGGE